MGRAGAADIGRRSLIATMASAPLVAAVPRGGRAQPAAGRIDAALLDRVADRAASLDQLHSLVVAHNGTVALAEAFRGPPIDRPVNVKSVSKTVVATLAGIAIERGIVAGVDQPVAELMPQQIPAEADPRVREITVAHLLTMQAGLERTSGANYGPWVASRNWVTHALTRPFVAAPGARMQYSTGSYHLLGAALAEASGDSLLALARDWLGTPLDIAIPAWTRDPQGFYLGGNNMALSPMALYRFGEMWRQGGLWQGRRVVPEDWIAQSWTPRTRSPWSGDTYGYGWFLAEVETESGRHPLAYGRGYGGQMVFVVPSLGLVVAITSDPTRPARSDGYVGDLRVLLAETIIPAVA